jgi:hypothetical protein
MMIKLLGKRTWCNIILIATLGVYLLGLSNFIFISVNDPVDVALPLQQLSPSEVAIVTYYVSQKNTSHKVHYSRDYYGRVANLTMTNLARYSQKHGMGFFFMNADMVDTNTKSAYWGKMDVIDHYLNLGYRWVIWTDIDVLFMDFSRSIFNEWIKPANASTHLLFVDECKAGKSDTGPVRSGFFAVRNSHEGKVFLESWKHTFNSYKHRKNPEQSALEGMMKNQRWSSIAHVSSHLDMHTYPKCYNGSTLSLHFPGNYKRYVDQYVNRVNSSSAMADFMIIVPG